MYHFFKFFSGSGEIQVQSSFLHKIVIFDEKKVEVQRTGYISGTRSPMFSGHFAEKNCHFLKNCRRSRVWRLTYFLVLCVDYSPENPKTRNFFLIFSYLNEYFKKKPNLLIQNIDISKNRGYPPPLKWSGMRPGI